MIMERKNVFFSLRILAMLCVGSDASQRLQPTNAALQTPLRRRVLQRSAVRVETTVVTA